MLADGGVISEHGAAGAFGHEQQACRMQLGLHDSSIPVYHASDSVVPLQPLQRTALGLLLLQRRTR